MTLALRDANACQVPSHEKKEWKYTPLQVSVLQTKQEGKTAGPSNTTASQATRGDDDSRKT
jgi:hypothetical protein